MSRCLPSNEKSDAVDRLICAQWAPVTAANRMHAWRQCGGEGPPPKKRGGGEIGTFQGNSWLSESNVSNKRPP